MRDDLLVSLLSVLPRRTLSRLQGRLARTGASRLLLEAYVRAYGVDLTDADVPAGGFATLDDLFSRRLARPRALDPDPQALLCPVDGRCEARVLGAAAGPALPGGVTVAELLGGAFPELHHDVDAVVLYLSPRDYHRVHCPLGGQVDAVEPVEGTLWPVYAAAVRRVPGLLARNARIVMRLISSRPALALAVVLVGAYGVGHIESRSPGPVRRGDELGAFRLGSTVVIVTPAGAIRWTVQPGDRVRMGRALGTRCGSGAGSGPGRANRPSASR